MNAEQAKKMERWLAGQFHCDNFRGGYQAAAGWPDSPIKPEILGRVAALLTRAEILDIRRAAALNLQHATELAARSERLHAGEIED
jgi:hypothetical protein